MKSFNKFLFVLFTSTLFFNGCKLIEYEEDKNSQENDYVNISKDYFYSYQSQNHEKSRQNEAFLIYPDWENITKLEDGKLLILPAYRRIQVHYSKDGYLRRLVFKFDESGEILRAGILELKAKDFDYLWFNQNILIKNYLNGIKENNVTYLWSDPSFSIIDGVQVDGTVVKRISNYSKDNKLKRYNLNTTNCIDWYWVYTYEGVVIGEEYSHTTCYETCDGNLELACLDDGLGGNDGGTLGNDDAPREKLCTNSFNNFISGLNSNFWHTNINGLTFENGQTQNIFNAYFNLANQVGNAQMNSINYSNTSVIGIDKTPIQLISDIFPHLLNSSDIYSMTMQSGELNWFFSKNAVMEISRWASNHAASGVIATIPNPHLPINQISVKNTFVDFANKFLKSIIPGSTVSKSINLNAPDSFATYGTNCQ